MAAKKVAGGAAKLAAEALGELSSEVGGKWLYDKFFSKEGQITVAHEKIRAAIDECAGFIAPLVATTTLVGGVRFPRFPLLQAGLSRMDEHQKLGLYLMVAAHAPKYSDADKKVLVPAETRKQTALELLQDLEHSLVAGGCLAEILDEALNDHGMVAEAVRQLGKIAEFLGRPATPAQVAALNNFKTRRIEGADATSDGSLLSFIFGNRIANAIRGVFR